MKSLEKGEYHLFIRPQVFIPIAFVNLCGPDHFLIKLIDISLNLSPSLLVPRQRTDVALSGSLVL